MSTKKSSRSKSANKSSSSRHVSNISEKSTGDTMQEETLNNVSNTFIFLAIIWQSLILLYLYKLEESDCECLINWKLDWRHSYIKNFTIVLICINILKILMSKLRKNKLLKLILLVLGLINLYAFFTYIHDLNKNNCNCATEKQYFLNILMKIFAWFRVISIIFILIFVIYYVSRLGHSKPTTK